jgi:hypothetical protein
MKARCKAVTGDGRDLGLVANSQLGDGGSAQIVNVTR